MNGIEWIGQVISYSHDLLVNSPRHPVPVCFSLLYYSLSALFVQLLSEKISGAEGTKLDEDFMEMERVSYRHDGW